MELELRTAIASRDAPKKVEGAIAVKPLRPLNRNRNFTGVPGQSGDPIALRRIASSKLMRTTCELFNSAHVDRSREASANCKPNLEASELFQCSQPHYAVRRAVF